MSTAFPTIDFIIEQDTKSGPWRSIPHQVTDKRHVRQTIIGGYLHGEPRRAVSLDGKTLYAIDAKGAVTDLL